MNDSLNELSKTNLQMATEPMIYFDFLLKRLPSWEQQFFYNQRWLPVPADKKFMYPEDAIPLVKKGELAYHTQPDVGYPIIDKTFNFREIGELMEVHIAQPMFRTLAASNNCTFLEIIKVSFAKMTEVGVRHRQIIRWTSKKSKCHKDEIGVTSTDIYEFAPHLILLVIGKLFAVLIFIIEIFIVRYEEKKTSNV
ncbi:hypothetical protein TKK_0006954 [Trichogramma kaykai]